MERDTWDRISMLTVRVANMDIRVCVLLSCWLGMLARSTPRSFPAWKGLWVCRRGPPSLMRTLPSTSSSKSNKWPSQVHSHKHTHTNAHACHTTWKYSLRVQWTQFQFKPPLKHAAFVTKPPQLTPSWSEMFGLLHSIHWVAPKWLFIWNDLYTWVLRFITT